MQPAGDLRRIASRTNGLNHSIAVGFVDDLNADGAGFVGFLPDEHEPILLMGHPNPQSHPCKIKTYVTFSEQRGTQEVPSAAQMAVSGPNPPGYLGAGGAWGALSQMPGAIDPEPPRAEASTNS